MKIKKEDVCQYVFDLVLCIPKGRVTTYGAIANHLGLGSARMVGWALKQCTDSIPAHRVVNHKGVLSGKAHFGGTVMQELLEGEGLKIKKDQVQEFKKYFWDPQLEL